MSSNSEIDKLGAYEINNICWFYFNMDKSTGPIHRNGQFTCKIFEGWSNGHCLFVVSYYKFIFTLWSNSTIFKQRYQI